MLVIRFFRAGKKNQPSFKIVVTDKRKSSVKGRYVEEVGFVDPLKDKKFLRAERIKYWISVGAKPSPTVHNLLITEKIIEGKKIGKFKKSKKKEEKKAETSAAAVAAVPAKTAEKETKPDEIAKPKEEKPAEVKVVPEKKKEKAPETPKAPEEKPKASEAKSAKTKSAETPEKKVEAK